MIVLLRRHPPKEVGEEARAERADGMRWHSTPQQPSQRIPTDASVDLQQRVAFALVLYQEQQSRPLARVHRAPQQRGPRIMEEVGSPREIQEENPGPSRRHPNSKGEGHEGVGDHRHLSRAGGGTTDEARVSPTYDGAQGITRWDDAR